MLTSAIPRSSCASFSTPWIGEYHEGLWALGFGLQAVCRPEWLARGGPRAKRQKPNAEAISPMPTLNSFHTPPEITVDGKPVQFYSLPALEKAGFPGVSRLPYSMKILLENLLRREDNAFVKTDDIRAVAQWKA